MLTSYPDASKIQKRIAGNVDYWCKWADVVIPGFIGQDGFGRWDVLIPTSLVLDTEKWMPTTKVGDYDGINGIVRIAHAPNHRAIKGTEFIVDALRKLQEEGLKVELILLEKQKNTEVRRVLNKDVDILVEQINYIFGLNALEGMASGLPTVSYVQETDLTTAMRRWSYFGECPLVSATPENLVDVLRKLVTRPELRRLLGMAGRAYVEKYHGLDSAQYLFSNVIDYVYGRKDSLINLYHPLLGEYPNRIPKIQHPLVRNRIVD
jgi:glycosyltransferase involved in cell wall biosynthesis